MKRLRVIAFIAVAALLLAACQDPQADPLARSGPGEWDASVWNTDLWE